MSSFFKKLRKFMCFVNVIEKFFKCTAAKAYRKMKPDFVKSLENKM